MGKCEHFSPLLDFLTDLFSFRVAAGMFRKRSVSVGLANHLHRHIHVSLRDEKGKGIFALPEDQVKTGRANAQYDDTKFLSQEGEWFLAGVLAGLPDSTSRYF